MDDLHATQTTPELDILIAGGTCLTMDDAMTVIENALIGIRDGRIVVIQDRSRSDALPPARETIDARRCLILPGLVNTHTHSPMVCFRGMADDLPLMDWLNNHIFPAEAEYVNAEMVYHGTILAVAEMLLSGTTTFADGYFMESRIAQAALDTGIRAVVAEGFIDFSPPDGEAVRKHIRRAEDFIQKWQGISDLVIPALFCHSPYACSARTLRSLKDCADAARMPYCIHVSETREEVRQILEREGQPPVHYLQGLGVLNESTIAIHCVWVDEEEIAILAGQGVKVSHTPESNMKLGCGIAPVPRMRAAGVVVGLGTDGAASNNNLDLFGEMNMAAKVHKAVQLDPTIMDATTVVWMATRGGARVLGLERLIGSVEKGKFADLILIDTRKAHWTPMYNPYSHLVYAASGSDVTTSIINGRIVMRDRSLTTLDLKPSIEKVNAIAKQIRTRRKSAL